MTPRCLQHFLCLFALTAGAALAWGCDDQIPVRSVAVVAEPIVWQSEPLEGTWRNEYWITSAAIVEYHADVAPRVDAEVNWCEEHRLEPPPEEERGDTFAPNADPELTAQIFTPISGEDLQWIHELRDELVARRGLPLDPLPSIRVISPDIYRRLSCWYMLNPDPEFQPDAYWEFERIVGYIEPDWTPSVLGHISSLTATGWYDSEDGASAITLITDLPLPQEFVSTIAHELVHAMQDQLKDGGLLDAWQEGSSDQHTAFRWVVEGDATTSEPAEDDAYIQDLIAARTWGEPQPYLYETAGISLSDIGFRGQSFFAAYLSGAEYVAEVQSREGWEGVNALLLEPPTTTEQIRHIDKLESREPPLDTEPLLALRNQVLGLDEDQELGFDMLGEQGLADLIFTSTTDEIGARRSATGWGVDLLSLTRDFNGEAGIVVIWQFAFDSRVRHSVGFEGLREWLINTSAAEAVGARNARAAGWDWQRGAIRVVDHANVVWLIAADDPEIADEVVMRVLKLKQPTDWWTPAAD